MGDDYDNSRDVIRDFCELNDVRAEYATLLEAIPEGVPDGAKEMLMHHTNWSPREEEEWTQLKDACKAGEEFPDWSSGTQLILEVKFNDDYAKELCMELGFLPSNGIPDFIVIDWNATADNLKTDYGLITICGDDYYIRS